MANLLIAGGVGGDRVGLMSASELGNHFPSWDLTCIQCKGPLAESDLAWFWLDDDLRRLMHAPCFIDWLQRLLPDYYNATKLDRRRAADE